MPSTAHIFLVVTLLHAMVCTGVTLLPSPHTTDASAAQASPFMTVEFASPSPDTIPVAPTLPLPPMLPVPPPTSQESHHIPQPSLNLLAPISHTMPRAIPLPPPVLRGNTAAPTPSSTTPRTTASTVKTPTTSKLPSASPSGHGTPPRWKRSPAIVYPSAARHDALTGTVHLLVTFNANGKITRVTVAKSSSHPVLDEAAARAVRKARVAVSPEFHPQGGTLPFTVVFDL